MTDTMERSTHFLVQPEEHSLTIQEAIEPVYNRLALECEARVIEAAVRAGWSAEEAVMAIEDLRKREMLENTH